MGRRGPQKLPTALHLLKGETRPSRIGRNPVAPRRTDAPTMPSDMTDAAKVVWRRVLREQAPGVITALDRDALRCYAEAVARYEESALLLSRSSLLVKGIHGNLVRNPLVQIVRDNQSVVQSWARELGLTPASRAGLTAPERDEADDESDYFGVAR